MTIRTDISYIIDEDFSDTPIDCGNRILRKDFEPAGGKLVLALWVKMDIHNTGVNLATLYGNGETGDEKEVLRIDTEGAYMYAYDGKRKQKLRHFQSDEWYSLYLSLNVEKRTYSLFVDGERLLRGAAFSFPAAELHAVSVGSYGGILYVKRMRLYRRPVQSVHDAVRDGRLFDAKEMGVAADGETVVTNELQRLIDDAGVSGGVVYLKEGVYLTGMLELKNNVTLYIEENAVLKGVLDLDAYPVRVSTIHPNWNTMVQGPQKSLIYADSQENIRIMGGGTIDGSGDFPGEYGSESQRVSLILLVGCPNAVLCDLYIKDAGMWTVPVVECDELYIHDLNLYSTWYPNRDGIDICDCHHVLVENCNIQADDDAVCFKSGNECGCDDVLVRNTCIISTMANGIKFGTYSYGGFTNCICEDCIVKDTRTCAISIQSVDGGRIRNLRFRRIIIQNVESVFFMIIADKGRIPDWGTHRIGTIEDIYFDSIDAENVRRAYGSYLGGYEKDGEVYRIRRIYFDRVHVIFQGGITEIPQAPPEFENQYPESNCFGVLPASAFFIRHADTVLFRECEFQVALPDERPLIDAVDCEDISVLK